MSLVLVAVAFAAVAAVVLVVVAFAAGVPHDVDTCAARMTSCMCRAGIDDLGSDLPALNRWHTPSPHLASQTLLLFTHDFARRLAHASYVVTPDTQLGDADGFHHVSNGRKLAAFEVLDAEDNPRTWGLALLASAPIEHLSNRLQHLDSCAGGSLLELTDLSERGCLARCQRAYWEMSNPWEPSTHSSLAPSMG
jgi:hypothetical protein